MGQVLLSDAAYADILDTRLEYLVGMRDTSRTSEYGERLDRCIDATEAAQAAAERLLESIGRLEDRFPPTAEAMVDRALELQEAIHEAALGDGVAARHAQFSRELWQEAADVVRAVALSADNDAEHAPALEEALSRRNGLERETFTQTLELLLLGITSFPDKVEAARTLAQLARVHRGLLYAAILKRQGGALQRRAISDAWVKLGSAIAGTVISGVDVAFAAHGLIDSYLGADASGKLVDHGETVIEFTDLYVMLLEHWMKVSDALAEETRSFAELL